MKTACLDFCKTQLLAAGVLLVANQMGVFQSQAQAPTIITQPADQVVSVGAGATFRVVASGSLPLSYQWRLNGANLSSQTANSLHFTGVTTNDPGSYSVVVGNSSGSVTSAPAALVVIPVLPGALDPGFNAGDINDVVRSVKVPGSDKTLIAGWFTSINGTNRNRLAQLNGDGSLDLSFNAGSGADNFVYALTLQTNAQILIGGAFSSFNGTNRPGIARLNKGNGSLDLGFNPGFGANAAVWSIAAQPDGKILIGGDFTTINGAERYHIARLNSDGSLDNMFTAGFVTASVRAIALQSNGQVLMGGMFGAVNGLQRFNLARLNSNGALDLSFDPSPNHWVFSILVQDDGKILVGGNFNGIGAANRNRVARLNNNGSVDLTFDPGTGANEGVSTMALQPDGKILVGGGFTQFDGRDQLRIARLHAHGGLDELFAPDSGADCWIESIALQNDGKVLIGGCFSSVNNTPRSRVARLMGSDPEPFAPIISSQPTNQAVGEGVNVKFQVHAFAFPAPAYQWQRNGTNLIGATNTILSLRNVRVANAGSYRVVVSNSLGSVTSVVAVLMVQPAPANPGAPDIDFYSGAGPNAQVNAVAAQSDGKVLIGGFFTEVDGVRRVGIARLNQNGSLDTGFNASASNGVNVVALQNDKVLIGGSFFSVNAALRFGIARLNGDGSLDATFNLTSTLYFGLNAIAVQTNGQIVIAGEFGVARLNFNGSTDPNFVAPVHDAVRAVAVQNDGKVLIGGEFVSVNNIERNRIARLNNDGSLDATFDVGSGANSSVLALLRQPDGKVLVAGGFTKIDGVTRNRLARLQTDGHVDLTFDPGFGPNDNVDSIALQSDGKIVAGGRFTAVSGVANSYVARLNTDGSPDLTFDSHLGPNDRVLAVALDGDGKVIIGGLFTKVNDTARRYVARLLGGNPAAFRPVIIEQPDSQAVAAGEDVTFTVMASGVPQPTYQWQFNGTNINGANTWTLNLRNVHVANAGAYTLVVNNALGTVVSFPAFLTVVPPPRHAGAADVGFYSGLGPNDRVNAVAVQTDEKILIGGAFTQVDGTNRNRVARLNRNGQLDLTFDPGLGANSRVNAVALQEDGRALIGGDFIRVNNTNRMGVARLNADGSLDLSFAPVNPFQPIYALALQANGQVLIGGAFVVVPDGVVRSGIARLNTNGSLDATFNAALDPFSPVLALKVQKDGKIIVGGQFTSVGGLTRAYVARLNIDGSVDPTFDPMSGASSLVRALALQDDEKIFVGGDFTYVSGTLRRRVARLLADGTVDANFNPGAGADDTVYSLSLQNDGRVLVGGSFNTFANVSRNSIARLNENGSLDLNFDPGSGATEGTTFIDEYGEFVDQTVVASIAPQGEGKVIIGGDFTKVNGVTRRYVARLFAREALPLIYIRTLTSQDAAVVELTWETGVLQVADELDGPWSDVLHAESPYLITPGGSQKFFRLKFN